MRNDAKLLVLDKNHVESLLTHDDVLYAVHEAFVLHSQDEGRVFPVVRESLVTGGVFGIKSGDVQSQNLLGYKAAGFWPSNRKVGGEPHQATVMLFDPETGRPTCLIDGNAITTVRTGAAGGLGLELFARPESTKICVIGSGVQARIQLQFALRMLPSMEFAQYVTYDGQRDLAFESIFANQCDLAHSKHPSLAVSGSDVVVTATPGGGELFKLEAVQPGTHINCVGTDTRGKRELPSGLLEQARVFVDDRIQAQQIGETQWAPSIHCTEIGDVLSGKEGFERRPGDITIFDMTGLALQDLTVARMLQTKANERGLGIQLPWPW